MAGYFNRLIHLANDPEGHALASVQGSARATKPKAARRSPKVQPEDQAPEPAICGLGRRIFGRAATTAG